MLSSTARGLPRFSMTRDRPSSSTRRRSLPKFARASRALTTIPSFINSPFRLIKLYSLINRNGEFMNDGIVVSALDARANFGKLLRRVEDEGRSLVIEKRGSPRAVLLSIRDYVRLAVPEPEVLRIIGQESKQKGTNRLGAKQIDQIVKAARRSKRR